MIPPGELPPSDAAPKRIRVTHFCTWADTLEDAGSFLARLPQFDVRARVTDQNDPRLEQMARLDCDWHGENARAFAAMSHSALEFLPARVVGVRGMLDFVRTSAAGPSDETGWLVFMGQNPQALAGTFEKLGGFLRRAGIKILYYAFDEASRTMPCFAELAPYLDVLIHDEHPLALSGSSRLRRDCITFHRSWVANLVPFAAPFVEEPRKEIVFLGSQLGLTPHRARQIQFLETKFKKTFRAVHDHSLSVADRVALNQVKVSFCPEGRKFTTAAMSHTHTDRPFWSGCLGMVPVSENARAGGRLDLLHAKKLIVRYPHADLTALANACEHALDMSTEERRRIYDHFNLQETIGRVVADAIARSSAASNSRPVPLAQTAATP